MTLDGWASAPGSAADLITGYSWEFNDGSGAGPANDPQAQNCSPVTGANATQPTHIFAEHGTYNVELTVSDGTMRRNQPREKLSTRLSTLAFACSALCAASLFGSARRDIDEG